MKCPQCKGYELEPRELEPGLIVGACTKCDGALISLMNYRFWADQQSQTCEVVSTVEVAEAEDNNVAQVCPKCSKFMTKFQIGTESVNRLDMCNGCDEAWLDKGEWQLLKTLDMADKLPKIFTDAWQRNIRIERQEKLHKKRYANLLGANDFAQ
ncbi:hypothetical protein A3715_30420, partial [Oleiphilus sp. HI0009]